MGRTMGATMGFNGGGFTGHDADSAAGSLGRSCGTGAMAAAISCGLNQGELSAGNEKRRSTRPTGPGAGMRDGRTGSWGEKGSAVLVRGSGGLGDTLSPSLTERSKEAEAAKNLGLGAGC
jgi:hypothetical protein